MAGPQNGASAVVKRTELKGSRRRAQQVSVSHTGACTRTCLVSRPTSDKDDKGEDNMTPELTCRGAIRNLVTSLFTGMEIILGEEEFCKRCPKMVMGKGRGE